MTYDPFTKAAAYMGAIAGPASVMASFAYICTQNPTPFQIANAVVLGAISAGATAMGIILIRDENLEQKIEKKDENRRNVSKCGGK